MTKALLFNSQEKPWSWSMRRSRMFETCPRRTFLHYYGGHGGHDAFNAPPRVRTLHLLKQLSTPEVYLRELLSESLREVFYGESGENFERSHRLRSEDFVRLVWRKYRRDVGGMWRGDFINDHRLPIISNVYFETMAIDEFFKNLEQRLKKILENPRLLETFDRLLATTPLRRIPLERPMSVKLGATPLYCTSTIAFKSDDMVVFLDLCNGAPDLIYRDSTILIHCYYAEMKFNMTPEKVISSFLDIDEGSEYIPSVFEANFSDVLDKISEDRGQQLAMVRDDGLLCESDFARNLTRCKYCNFRKECCVDE